MTPLRDSAARDIFTRNARYVSKLNPHRGSADRHPVGAATLAAPASCAVGPTLSVRMPPRCAAAASSQAATAPAGEAPQLGTVLVREA